MLSNIVCCNGRGSKKKVSLDGKGVAPGAGPNSHADFISEEPLALATPQSSVLAGAPPMGVDPSMEKRRTRKSVAQASKLRQSIFMQSGRASTVEQKMFAGYQAIDDHAKDNMVIAISSGQICSFAHQKLRMKVQAKELTNITIVPMSKRAEETALSNAFPMGTLDSHPDIDLMVDEADEVDEDLSLVKGGTGLLTREKMIAKKAKKKVIVIDASKLCDHLGAQPLPVEVVPFCHEHTMRKLEQLPAFRGLGCQANLRHGDISNTQDDGEDIAITENGNYIVDLKFETRLQDGATAAEQLTRTVGVVEHGLFIKMVDFCIISGPDGVSVAEPGDVYV